MSKTQQQFDEALACWLQGVRKLSDCHYARNLPSSIPTKFDLLYGKKFIRVVSFTPDTDTGKCLNRSAFAFIAMVNTKSKALGQVKQGDVMRAATWSAPAKYARGNIFDDNNGLKYISPYGPAYLA